MLIHEPLCGCGWHMRSKSAGLDGTGMDLSRRRLLKGGSHRHPGERPRDHAIDV